MHLDAVVVVLCLSLVTREVPKDLSRKFVTRGRFHIHRPFTLNLAANDTQVASRVTTKDTEPAGPIPGAQLDFWDSKNPENLNRLLPPFTKNAFNAQYRFDGRFTFWQEQAWMQDLSTLSERPFDSLFVIFPLTAEHCLL